LFTKQFLIPDEVLEFILFWTVYRRYQSFAYNYCNFHSDSFFKESELLSLNWDFRYWNDRWPAI